MNARHRRIRAKFPYEPARVFTVRYNEIRMAINLLREQPQLSARVRNQYFLAMRVRDKPRAGAAAHLEQKAKRAFGKRSKAMRHDVSAAGHSNGKSKVVVVVPEARETQDVDIVDWGKPSNDVQFGV